MVFIIANKWNNKTYYFYSRKDASVFYGVSERYIGDLLKKEENRFLKVLYGENNFKKAKKIVNVRKQHYKVPRVDSKNEKPVRL
jgi:hypothetical protein